MCRIVLFGIEARLRLLFLDDFFVIGGYIVGLYNYRKFNKWRDYRS